MAKNGLDGTPIKRQFARLRVYFVWGTSAAAPFFAGMMALVDQQTASQQGHADYGLYKLAHSESLSHVQRLGYLWFIRVYVHFQRRDKRE